MKRRTLLRYSLAAGASLALAGCGFQLRGLGTSALPFAALTVDGQDDDFTRLLQQRLQDADVDLTTDARWQLNLGREAFTERRLSVLQSGYQEYDMILNVPFSVQRRADGAYRLSQQVIETQERFSISSDNLLSADEVRREVQQRLRRDAVEQLFHRLHVLGEA